MKRSIILALFLIMVLGALLTPSGSAMATTSQSDRIQELAFDVIFVIDGSGSMRNSDPDKIAVEAAKLFTDMCEYSSSRVGYVVYTHKLVEKCDLTEISDDAARNEFKRKLSSIKYIKSGDTDIALGLTQAMQMLIGSGSIGSNRNPLIILLSDGNTDLPKGPRTVEESEAELASTTQLLKEYGVPVYTIGLNADSSLDTQAMADIAQTTSAKTYETSDARDLPDILSQIFADHINVKEFELDSFTGDNTSHRVTIPIPNDSIYEANIIILSSKPVKDLHLYAPGGVEVSIPSDSIKLSTSNCYTLIKIISPMVGDWVLELIGAEGDQITINLLKSYDFELFIDDIEDQVYRTKEVTVSIGFRNEDGVINDEDVFVDAEGMLYIENAETGEVMEQALTYNGSTMTASVPFDTLGDYRLSASVTGSNDSFHKESDVVNVSVIPNPITAKVESIDEDLWIGFKDSLEYSFYDLVSWDESEGIKVISDYNTDAAVCDVEVDHDDAVIKINAERGGEAYYSLTFADGYGQSVSIPVTLRITPLWPYIMGLLLVLITAAVIIAIIKLKNRPDLNGKLSVSVNGTRNTPPDIELEMAALQKTKGKISLMHIVVSEPMYGQLVGQALAEIGSFAMGITVTALDRECNRIRISIPAVTRGSVMLNGREVSGNRTVDMSKESELSIRYGDGNQAYEIMLCFERDSFNGDVSILGDVGMDPFGGTPGSMNDISNEDPFASMSPNDSFGNDPLK